MNIKCSAYDFTISVLSHKDRVIFVEADVIAFRRE